MTGENKTSNFKSFSYLENGEILFSVYDTIKSSKVIEPGVYNVRYLNYPQNRIKLEIDNTKESIKEIDFSNKKEIDNLFESFYNIFIHKKVKSLGFYHKTGILLYGKEGTGKSSILRWYYSKTIIENQAIVFKINQLDSNIVQCWEFIENIRKIQNNPIIVIFEEFDAIFECKENSATLKRILDGDRSIDNCIFLATTNLIEKIPSAIKNRKSRFKYILEIETIQNIDFIVEVLNNLIGDLFKKEEIIEFAKELNGTTIDDIKHFAFDKIMSLKNIKDKIKIGF